MTPQDFVTEVEDLVRQLAEEADTETSTTLDELHRSLAAPPRIALIGHLKTGKSTLLNAIAGEPLAATDGLECTRVVTRYRGGIAYRATAHLRDGRTLDLLMDRVDGALQIRLPDESEEIQFVDVEWPSASMGHIDLIDTPGLGSERGVDAATWALLAEAEGGLPPIDGLVYLLDHTHPADLAFLEELRHAPPNVAATWTNAIAVLARADEIAGGAMSSMSIADQLASRLMSEPTMAASVSQIVPLAGLLAQAAAMLTQSDHDQLVAIADLDDDRREFELAAVQFFVSEEAGRGRLLDRFGLYGVRLAVDAIRSGDAPTATALAGLLAERSGLERLRRELRDTLVVRAGILRADNALTVLEALGTEFTDGDLRRIGRLRAASPDVDRRRLAELILDREVELAAEETVEIFSVLGATSAVAEVGRQEPSLAAAAARWRTLGSDPRADSARRELCDIVVRSYDALRGTP